MELGTFDLTKMRKIIGVQIFKCFDNLTLFSSNT